MPAMHDQSCVEAEVGSTSPTAVTPVTLPVGLSTSSGHVHLFVLTPTSNGANQATVQTVST